MLSETQRELREKICDQFVEFPRILVKDVKTIDPVIVADVLTYLTSLIIDFSEGGRLLDTIEKMPIEKTRDGDFKRLIRNSIRSASYVISAADLKEDDDAK